MAVTGGAGLTSFAAKLGPALSSEAFISSVAAGLILALFGLFLRFFNPRPNVRWGLSHGFAFNTAHSSGSLLVTTQTVFLHNIGTANAENLEVHLNYAPTHFELWPNVKFSTSTTPAPSQHLIIEIPNFARKERLSVEMLQVGSHMPMVMRVRHKHGDCKEVQLRFNELQSNWKNALIVCTFLLGCFYIIRIVIGVGLKLSGLTP